MADIRKFGSTSNLIRFTLKDKTAGQGKTGLTGSTTGLIISTICDNEASATVYTQAATHIQTITTLGTYSAPSALNCRFGEVDATNHKGLYEFQFADARFAVSNAKRMVVSVNDAEATILDADYEIELVQFDPFDAVHLGLSALPNTACTTNASLLTSGTGTDQISVTSGHVIPTGQTVKKNAAKNAFMFPMIDSANRPTRKSGAIVSASRSIDAALFAACANSASEIGSTGVYKIDLASTDLNGDTVILLLTAPGCDDTFVEILTQP